MEHTLKEMSENEAEEMALLAKCLPHNYEEGPESDSQHSCKKPECNGIAPVIQALRRSRKEEH